MRNDSNIFISYSWKNKSIVDEIDNDFKRVGISFIRDERDLKDYEKISTFMKRVRDCDYVLMVISDAYLKSNNCLYEVLEFKKEQEYEKRILPILLTDAEKIRTLEGKAEYIKYWQDELIKGNNILNGIDILNSPQLVEKIKIIERIGRDMGEFLELITDLKIRSLEELKLNNYKSILDFIEYESIDMLSELLRIYALKDDEEQEIELDTFRKKYGETAEYFFMNAYKANENKAYKKAKYYYEVALRLNPNDYEAHNNLAILFKNEYFKDYEGAREHYEEALRLNPNFSTAHYNLAILLENKYFKDYEGARGHFEEALRLNPNDFEVLKNLANLLKNEYFKDYEGARGHYEEALRLNPNDFETHINLTILLEKYFKEDNN